LFIQCGDLGGVSFLFLFDVGLVFPVFLFSLTASLLEGSLQGLGI
jgi:hypothetical protein